MALQRDSKLAKRLARLVIEGGESVIPQLRPALERVLEGRSAASRKAFLAAFHKAVLREIDKDTLTIESAQALSASVRQEIIDHFGKDHARPLHLVEKTTPDLIAGIRVRLGDTVYDASLSSNLRLLASRLR